MVNFVRCKEGNKWSLTELGMEESRIRAKYEEHSVCRKQYEQIVPKSWVERGYVVEVSK